MIRCGLPRIRNRRGGPLRPRGSRHRGPRRPRGGTDPADAGGAAGSGWLDDPGAVRTRPTRAGPRAAGSARAGADLRNASPAQRNPPRLAPCGPGTTATGRTYGALVHRETHAEGSRWAFDIPVPGAAGQAWRARPAQVSKKPRSGRRGAGDRARRRGRRVAASGRHRRGVGEGGQLLARGRGRPAGDDVHVIVRLDGPPVQGRR